jgi:DNA-binding transcriptional regulator LsrR (DeoR family)
MHYLSRCEILTVLLYEGASCNLLAGMNMNSELPDLERFHELNLLARCAHLHFRENRSQQEIAKILGLNRSKVSRFMKRLVSDGYVEIKFSFPQMPELAGKLCEKYGLRDAVVVPTGQPEYLRADIGSAAARYFERVVGDGASVGVSCGMTLYEMVREVRKIDAKGLTIYPLAADISYESVDIFPNTLVGMLVAKLRPNAVGYAFPAQIIEKQGDVIKRRREILEQPRIKKIFEASSNVDVAFIGVGAIKDGVPGFCMIAQDYGLRCADILRETDAVAEYNYALVDSDGRSLAGNPQLKPNDKFQEVTNRILSVSIEVLKELAARHGKLVVCVAGGDDKLSGIRAVLTGSLANVLITDFETGVALV